MKRRDFLAGLVALPTLSTSIFSAFDVLAQPARGMIKVTAIKAIELREGRTLIKIETDAGISGYGEAGADGPTCRAAIALYNGGGRLPHQSVIGKDPLSIQVHHHNMFYAYEQRGRGAHRVMSGVDTALWDLAGKILNQPVSKLLGGNFRDEIECYSHCPGGDYLSKSAWAERAAELKAGKYGFKTFKVDTHHVLGLPMQETTPSLDTQDFRKMATAYAMCREALGDDINILVHCHTEFDVPSSIGIAHAIEPISPLYFEDPLQDNWSEGWNALRRATKVPLMTGENMELVERAIPFLENQAVDIFQPDIVNCGGITGTRMLAEVANRYRIPIALHNVAGIVRSMATQQLAASLFNCPRIECSIRAPESKWAIKNPIIVRNGMMQVSKEPGIGIDLDHDWLRANLKPGEPWWG